MFRKIKNFTLQTMAGANIATAVVMFLVGHSDLIDPASFPVLSNAGLAFPIFLVINLAFLVLWIVFNIRGVLIPLLSLLLCYGPVRRYCPFNISHEPPAEAIKVMSYNVWLFAGWEDKKDEENPILEYIRKENADIVCLQESGTNEVSQARVDAALNPIYQYHDTLKHGTGECITLYSKYPIISKERIEYQSKGNLSGAFQILVDGKPVLVINNHLETTGLSHEEKVQFKTMLKGDMKADTVEMTSKMMLRKLGAATAIRAPQAEAVARYIAFHSDMPTIVCGDFNDGPISYARRTIAEGLTDCYVETAVGPGISYHHNGFYVRIDHILCSPHFEPFACRVDDKIKSSDHYPIICWLKMRAKP